MVLGLLVVVALAAGKLPPPGPGGFQGVKWGASRDDIAAAFGGSDPLQGGVTVVNEGEVIANVKIGDDVFTGSLRLVDGRLVQARILNGWSGEPGPAVEAYERLRAALQDKYGRPKGNDAGARGSRLAKVRAGADVTSAWSTSDTEISLLVHGRAGEQEVMLVYTQRGADALLRARAKATAAASRAAAQKDL
jgi:hypothetical protein